ncbi:hypothetical protein ACFVFS_14140 [Kitasatospora sp. NPDC057692]|uniref:hypothetical protein n=1 Tax=Kitasatospora sp. NPDC057692 TaxID=3346215 RepID=UPI0036C22B02
MPPAPDERDRIRAAAHRILAGTPENSNGALTVVALAIEAGVPRNALTQRHLDLREDFYARVRALGRIPDSEARLRKQIVKLKELRAADTRKLRELSEDRQALVQVVNQLTLENHRLRGALTESGDRVRTLPVRGHPGP